MKVITGGTGQLGQEIFKQVGTGFQFPERGQLNLENLKNVHDYFDNDKIKLVIHAGAYTNVEMAEDQKELAEKINSRSTEIIAQMARKHQFKLIYVSTDYVFDGQKKVPYTETDTPNPVNFYGQTKYLGEQAVLSLAPESLVVRTAWLYSKQKNNFVQKMIQLSERIEEIRVVDDQIGTLTYAPDLAQFLLKYPELSGLFHFSGEGCSSWYEVAVQIMQTLGTNTRVLPISATEYGSRAVRPNYSVLDKSKLKNQLNIVFPDWKESLNLCLAKTSL